MYNITSPSYPYPYTSDKFTAAYSVTNYYYYDETVVFFVKYVNLRPGDTLQLFSHSTASSTACLDKTALKQYNGTVKAGQQTDFVVTSYYYACYLFDVVGVVPEQRSNSNSDAHGFVMDIYCACNSTLHFTRLGIFFV